MQLTFKRKDDIANEIQSDGRNYWFHPVTLCCRYLCLLVDFLALYLKQLELFFRLLRPKDEFSRVWYTRVIAEPFCRGHTSTWKSARKSHARETIFANWSRTRLSHDIYGSTTCAVVPLKSEKFSCDNRTVVSWRPQGWHYVHLPFFLPATSRQPNWSQAGYWTCLKTKFWTHVHLRSLAITIVIAQLSYVWRMFTCVHLR